MEIMIGKQNGRGKQLFILLLAGIIGTGMVLSACTSGTKHEHQQFTYLDAFDTISYFDVYLQKGEDASAYEEAIHEELLRYHRMFDAYNSYEGINNVYTINSEAGKSAVAVDEELFELVQFCLDNMEKTNYRTNIVMGSVTGIWKDFLNTTAEIQADDSVAEIVFPTQEELEQAAAHTDWNKVVLDEDEKTIFLEDENMVLDVGAVAKGYTAEKLADYMKSLGIESASINMGGNIKFIGTRNADDGRTYWISSIQDPETMSAYNMGVRMEDGGTVVTSGNYERYVTVDDIRYCHLIDPDTLWPVQNMASVSIIAKDSGLADYLSTALFTVDVETGKEILSHYDDVEAFWVTSDYETYYTDGFEDMLVK